MDNSNVDEAQGIDVERHPDTVLVRVVTTAGAFPHKGEDRVRSTEIVDTVLREAAKALHLTDTTGWIALVDGNPIDTSHSFAADGLTGKVVIHWGPREGGGGQ